MRKFKILNAWIMPIIIALGLFVLIRPVLAQTINVPVVTSAGSEPVDGYTQVYFEAGGEKKFITSGNVNSRMPVFAGEYIAYVTDINGAGQIFLYEVSSGAKTQLTFLGTSLNPKVDDKGRVVWEGWDAGTWQVFFFDGKSVRQLTAGDTSLNPDFGGGYISYGRRGANETWRAVVYSIADGKSIDVTIGEKARNPKIRGGEIYLAVGSLAEEKFPLSVSDLFLLNLAPLTATGSALFDELNATASGVVEVPLSSESGNLAPQSTSSGQLEGSPPPGT